MIARVMFERQDGFDLQHGPYGYERVGFAIGDRVFWTGCAGSGMSASTYEDDKKLAYSVVARWNQWDKDNAELGEALHVLGGDDGGMRE